MSDVNTSEDVESLRKQLSLAMKCIIDIKDLIVYLPKSDVHKLQAISERLGISKEEKKIEL